MDTVPLTAQTLFDALGDTLQLHWVAGRSGAARALDVSHGSWGGATLVGHLNLINPYEIQVIGPVEMEHLTQLPPPLRAESIQRLFQQGAGIVIVTDALAPTRSLRAAADAKGLPLFTSPRASHELVSTLRYYLSEVLAERTTVHGVLMEVLGIGVLITGDSNVGKSELALELVTRGHRLIADDAPELARITPHTLQARCHDVLQDLLEVRGLGVINVRAMYGHNAIRDRKDLHLIIDLRLLAPQTDENTRLRGDRSVRTLLGIEVPLLVIHVAPSRNLAVLVEAAVRNHLLLQSGYDAAEDLSQRQQRLIEAQRP